MPCVANKFAPKVVATVSSFSRAKSYIFVNKKNLAQLRLGFFNGFLIFSYVLKPAILTPSKSSSDLEIYNKEVVMSEFKDNKKYIF